MEQVYRKRSASVTNTDIRKAPCSEANLKIARLGKCFFMEPDSLLTVINAPVPMQSMRVKTRSALGMAGNAVCHHASSSPFQRASGRISRILRPQNDQTAFTSQTFAERRDGQSFFWVDRRGFESRLWLLDFTVAGRSRPG